MSIFEPEIEIVEKEDVSVSNDDDVKKGVFLYNDPFNTFEHVIESLIIVCQMSADVAKNCANKVHTEGKCLVAKNKTDAVLKKIECDLRVRGLDARIN
jgi:ATP-dependent Clp protease adaptor protein ClpS